MSEELGFSPSAAKVADDFAPTGCTDEDRVSAMTDAAEIIAARIRVRIMQKAADELTALRSRVAVLEAEQDELMHRLKNAYVAGAQMALKWAGYSDLEDLDEGGYDYATSVLASLSSVRGDNV